MTATLRALILEVSEYLDPQKQGIHWPDPIAFDGRPLAEQASDLCALLDAREGDAKASLLSDMLADARTAALELA